MTFALVPIAAAIQADESDMRYRFNPEQKSALRDAVISSAQWQKMPGSLRRKANSLTISQLVLFAIACDINPADYGTSK